MSTDFPGTKITNINPSKQRFPEIPDMLFGEDNDGAVYFDATALIEEMRLSDSTIHTFIKDLRVIISAIMQNDPAVRGSRMVMDNQSGHYYINQNLKFWFLCYADPHFTCHIQERLEELFENGMTLSDSFIVRLAHSRLTPDILNILANGGEKAQ